MSHASPQWPRQRQHCGGGWGVDCGCPPCAGLNLPLGLVLHRQLALTFARNGIGCGALGRTKKEEKVAWWTFELLMHYDPAAIQGLGGGPKQGRRTENGQHMLWKVLRGLLWGQQMFQ